MTLLWQRCLQCFVAGHLIHCCTVRRIIIITALALLIPSVLAQSQPFSDTVGHAQQAQIESLRVHGIVQGYDDGRFLPDALANRAGFLKMLMFAAGGEVPVSDTTGCFVDFYGEEQWFWAPACVAKERGIISGYPDGTFRGEQSVTLAEAVKMAVLAWKIPVSQQVRATEQWYEPYFASAAYSGFGTYFRQNPGHRLTRGDAAWLLVAFSKPLAVIATSQPSSSAASSFSSSRSSALSWFIRPVTVHSVCGDGVKEGTEACDDGNKEDGDGCSSLCIIVPEPIQHAAIRLDQRELGTDTLTGGSSQTILFAFDAGARWQQAILTGLKFQAENGNLRSAVNYRLYQDEDGDGRAESPVGTAVVRDGILSFSGLDPIIHIERGTRFEVHADLVQTAGATLALGFLTTDPTYVEAVGAIDGRQLVGIRTDQSRCPTGTNCWIAVYTKPAAPVTVTERGSLFVSQGNEPVRSHQLLMGSATDDLLHVNLRATEEDVRVTRLVIQGAGGSLSHLELFFPGASTPFTTASVSQCRTPVVGRLCAVMNLMIRKDFSQNIVVRGVVESDADGAVSGDTVALEISASTTGTDPAVEATGDASQQNLTQNDGDSSAEGEVFIGVSLPQVNSAITGPVSDIVAAKFVEVSNGSTDIDGSPVPLGERSIGTFLFRAASASASMRSMHKASIQTLTFSVTASNIRFSAGSFVLANTSVPYSVVPCTETAITGVITVTCSALEVSGANTIFDQGQTGKLALKAYVENSEVVPGGSGILQVSLGSISDRTTTGAIEWDDGTTTFGWVDITDTAVRSTAYRTP